MQAEVRSDLSWLVPTRSKALKESRKYSEKRYNKHLRHNKLYAEPGKHQFVIILDHLKPLFNIGKIFRSADGFGARAVHLVGTSYFDAKSAKGSLKWVPVVFNDSFEICYRDLEEEDFTFYLLDPAAESSLHNTILPVKSAFVFGHEEFGVSFDPSAFERVVSVKVEQVGRVESLNVSIAASIAMYEYFRQHSG